MSIILQQIITALGKCEAEFTSVELSNPVRCIEKLESIALDYAGRCARQENRINELYEILESAGLEHCCWCRESGNETWLKPDEIAARAEGDDVYGAMCKTCHEIAIEEEGT